MADHDLTDEELAREMAGVDGWSEERLAAVRSLGGELADIAASAGGEEQISRLIAAGRPMRDWIIYIARKEADWNAERARRSAGRTRASPVTPCEDYDPIAFWKGFERFKAAVAGLEALRGPVGIEARAASLVAFREGRLPTDLADWERDLVELADRALTETRTALSIPAEWSGRRGSKKSLDTDLLNLSGELDRFEELVARERPERAR